MDWEEALRDLSKTNVAAELTVMSAMISRCLYLIYRTAEDRKSAVRAEWEFLRSMIENQNYAAFSAEEAAQIRELATAILDDIMSNLASNFEK